MIPRYTRSVMEALWSDQTKYSIWLEIEINACDAMASLGIIPIESAKNIREKANFNVEKIHHIEKETKHDVIAFLTNLSEYIGEDARFIHQGMTSSDVLDTCLNIQLQRATDILISDLDDLLSALKEMAYQHKYTPTMGRSHGVHAEPTSFGLKIAMAYAEFFRNRQRLLTARAEISTCAISGAIGSFANINPEIETHIANVMGLKPEPISSQIIPRDRHAMYFSILAVIAGSIERLATEIRHLQRTEVLEAEEYFSKGQKGSSAMPHKRNPVLCENLTGLARLIRSAVYPALENIALWHERDISHSSVERGIAPDATTHLDFALNRLTHVIQNLVVYPEKMKKNLEQLLGLHNSQRILLALTQKGMSRENAYQHVQKNAMKTWNGDGDFLEQLKQDSEITKLMPPSELEEFFDLDYHYKYVHHIFKRVFEQE